MYDVIEELINHQWQSNYTSDQQYIYYIVGCLIVIFSVFVLDLIKCVINSAAGKR